jgi:hypothetical protein
VNPSQYPLWLLHNLLEELDEVTTKPYRRRQPPRVTRHWRSLNVPPSASRSHGWHNALGSLDHSLECHLKQCVWVSVWKAQMCSMYSRNGQDSSHTWAPLQFIPLQTLLAVMGNLPPFLRTRGRSTPYGRTVRCSVTTIFPFESVSKLSESQMRMVCPPRSDGLWPGNINTPSSAHLTLIQAGSLWPGS